MTCLLRVPLAARHRKLRFRCHDGVLTKALRDGHVVAGRRVLLHGEHGLQQGFAQDARQLLFLRGLST